MSALVVHGGRLRNARALFPGAQEPWLDLSTGVSPWPYPASFATAADRARLPDPVEIADLEAVAAAAFQLPAACVLAVAGGEAGIRLLAATLDVDSVGVVEPTYSGHRAAWMAAGAEVHPIQADQLQRPLDQFDAVVIVNPNNPDGRAFPADILAALAHGLGSRQAWLIVDEAFVDQDPALSISNHRLSGLGSAALITLRSFGKFYGLPGVRLGFLTGAPRSIRRLRERRGEWSVSADAIAAGVEAYADHAWAIAARRRIRRASDRLDGLLNGAGFDLLGGTGLFRLAGAADASARFRGLAELGVLTRPFADAATWLRFGLPPPSGWERLTHALAETAS